VEKESRLRATSDWTAVLTFLVKRRWVGRFHGTRRLVRGACTGRRMATTRSSFLGPAVSSREAVGGWAPRPRLRTPCGRGEGRKACNGGTVSRSCWRSRGVGIVRVLYAQGYVSCCSFEEVLGPLTSYKPLTHLPKPPYTHRYHLPSSLHPSLTHSPLTVSLTPPPFPLPPLVIFPSFSPRLLPPP